MRRAERACPGRYKVSEQILHGAMFIPAILEWNEMRNALEHHSGTDKDPLTFSAFDAAFEMINRANINGEHLEVRA